MPSNLAVVMVDEPGMRKAIEGELSGRDDIRYQIYDDPKEFYGALDNDEICCIVVDIGLREFLAQEILSEIRSRNILAPTIMVTNYHNTPQAMMLMKEGAFDVVEKPFRFESLVSRIKSAFRLHKENKRLFNERAAASPILDKLTDRQFQIIKLLAMGKTHKEVADELGICVKTTKNTVGQVKKKLKIGLRVDLVNWVEAMRLYEERVAKVKEQPEPSFSWLYSLVAPSQPKV